VWSATIFGLPHITLFVAFRQAIATSQHPNSIEPPPYSAHSGLGVIGVSGQTLSIPTVEHQAAGGETVRPLVQRWF
jgi:hypothetical protein